METTVKKEQKVEHTSTSSATITKDMTIGEVVAKWPETAEIMLGYGLHCIGCHVNPYESIEGGAYGHGMSKETVEQLVKEMNEAVESHEDKDIALSDSAIKKFAELMEKEGKAGWGLKFSVEPGGCSGFSYVMDFAQKPEESEQVVTEKGMKIFVDKSVLSMVKGVRIDFTDGLQGSGFKISNPNAHGSCGCGKSFH
ncbi:MAG TPA: iron-sulfur cluster assembly accessory protein [archaeon]|nr:iron-sulfur cluster assembly accessory protein [archaeon]